MYAVVPSGAPTRIRSPAGQIGTSAPACWSRTGTLAEAVTEPVTVSRTSMSPAVVAVTSIRGKPSA